MLIRALGSVVLLALATAASGVETKKLPAELTAQEIQQCVQQNFPDDSMTQTLKMVSKDRLGVERVLEAEMFWEKDQTTRLSKVLLKFDNPPELRGAAVLVLEKKPQNDMFMFLPELGKTRRITTQMVQGNMMGTDFSYEDFSRLQGMISSLSLERLPDEQVADRTAFVTLGRPGDADSEYDRIRSAVDQETCVPLRVEFFAKGSDEPAKVILSDPSKVTKEKTGWIPREIRMEDLRGGTSTSLQIDKLKVSVPIDRKIFS
ncbi:MAG: outer membrane lipoprotein-sorting protein, partial [Myxococcota bacterium]